MWCGQCENSFQSSDERRPLGNTMQACVHAYTPHIVDILYICVHKGKKVTHDAISSR